MNSKRILFAAFVLLLIINFSCKEENIILTEEQLGYNYFPVQIGDSKIYKTDSIYFQKSNSIYNDTSTSFTMELVSDTFRRSDGNLVYNISVFNRKDESKDWVLVDNYFIIKTKSNIEKQEDGLNYIKLIFPIRKFVSWNGNIQLSQENQLKINGEFFQPFKYWNGTSYYYKDIQENYSQLNKLYPQVAIVEEIDYDDDLNRIYSEARYALNVGLIYREFWILSTEVINPELSWIEKAQYGIILKQALIP
ncbi:MAG: hypothetical protein IT267_07305 [Saprospiraceae bacterium]|nr:hypothetical protein [Saprospiraceae bacterium]